MAAVQGCHWTSRLKMELCGGDGCHESEILAFDFQRRAWEYYEAGKMMAHSYHDCMLKANCLSVRKLELSELSELVLCSPCCSYCSTSYCLCVCVWGILLFLLLGKSKGKALAPPLEEASLIMSMPVEEACPILAHEKTWPKCPSDCSTAPDGIYIVIELNKHVKTQRSGM